MHEMVGIAAVPNQNLEYIKSLQGFYKAAFDSSVPDFEPKKHEPSNVVPWQQASKIMWAAMKAKKRLDCGG